MSVRIGRLSPSIVPYIHLSRLLYFFGPNPFFWASAWGLTLGSREVGLPLLAYFQHLLVYFFSSLLFHSVGSAWDDICDRDIDAQIERTKNRPLVVGTATVFGTSCFILPQLIVLLVLLKTTNDLTMLLGMICLFVFVPLYPVMKRVTYWPQAWLGVVCQFCVLIGCTSVTSSLSSPALLILSAGTVCWTIYFDTIYGAMDLEDDRRIGVKSTAVLFGKHIRIILATFSTAFVLSLIMVGRSVTAPSWYYFITVFGSLIHFTWQLMTVDFQSKDSCLFTFCDNFSRLGYLVWLGLFVVYQSA